MWGNICFIFQYNPYSLKHIFPIEKLTFLFPQHRNLWTEFLAICSGCSSLDHCLKTLYYAEIL